MLRTRRRGRRRGEGEGKEKGKKEKEVSGFSQQWLLLLDADSCLCHEDTIGVT